MSPAVIIGELEARHRWSDQPAKRAQQETWLSRVEDYLLINGNRLSAARAAERLGLSERTICRYRAALRAIGATP